MIWVKITSVQEAIVQVDLPLDAEEHELREAALAKLDESGGAEWEGVDGEVEVLRDRSVLTRLERAWEPEQVRVGPDDEGRPW